MLAVEWGSGRREGWLSNIHLGARDESSETGFVMLGKTFKGMTDEMLAWQTERFTELAVDPATVRDTTSSRCGRSRSSRSPSTASSAPPATPAASPSASPACVRYRDDKAADEADTIETVRAPRHRVSGSLSRVAARGGIRPRRGRTSGRRRGSRAARTSAGRSSCSGA